MKKYNFDKSVNRKNTNSITCDVPLKYYKDADIIPMWIADMSFETCDEIVEQINKRLEHRIFGYTSIPESYYKAVIDWQYEFHNWKLKKEDIIFSSSTITSLNGIIRTFTKPGDEIIIQPPVYPQFANTIRNCGRIVIENPLLEEDMEYKMDLKSLEDIISEKTRLLILCNPHNPVGRVWTQQELLDLCEVCTKNGIIVVSDEVHSDLVYKDIKHNVFSNISKEAKKNSIVCISPNKTFNIAGLKTGNIVVEDEEKNKILRTELLKRGLLGGNILGIVAQEAAYRYGKDWYTQLLEYLENNMRFAINFIKKNIPELKVSTPQATYLLWIDFSDLGLDSEELNNFLIKDCKLMLSSGGVFGDSYSLYRRMNIALSRKNLEEALNRLNTQIQKIKGE